MSRQKIVEKTMEPCWIPESRCFFKHVIKDTLDSLRKNTLLDVSRTEKKALVKLQKQWLHNYNPSDYMPESNPLPLPPKPKRPRAAVRKHRARPAAKATPIEEYVDVTTLDDNEKVIYRIQIPPLKKHWICRSFDIELTAKLCKMNMVEPLISWELLDSIMEVPEKEGTAILQGYVDSMIVDD